MEATLPADIVINNQPNGSPRQVGGTPLEDVSGTERFRRDSCWASGASSGENIRRCSWPKHALKIVIAVMLLREEQQHDPV